MTDIVERARYVAKIKSPLDRDKALIARLADEVDQLRAALEAIVRRSSIGRSLTYKSALNDLSFIHKRARRALEEK